MSRECVHIILSFSCVHAVSVRYRVVILLRASGSGRLKANSPPNTHHTCEALSQGFDVQTVCERVCKRCWAFVFLRASVSFQSFSGGVGTGEETTRATGRRASQMNSTTVVGGWFEHMSYAAGNAAGGNVDKFGSGAS